MSQSPTLAVLSYVISVEISPCKCWHYDRCTSTEKKPSPIQPHGLGRSVRIQRGKKEVRALWRKIRATAPSGEVYVLVLFVSTFGMACKEHYHANNKFANCPYIMSHCSLTFRQDRQSIPT